MSVTSNNSTRIRVVAANKLSLKIIDLPMELARVNPNQPRKHFDEQSLKDLATSIKQHGLLQPITVTKDKRNKDGYMVVAGERRFRAFQLLKKDIIPAVVTSGNPDEIALIENLQREDLSALEEAEALSKLKKKYSYNNVELGKAIGKHRSTVSEILRINDLPRKVKQEVRTSNTNKSILIELSKAKDKKAQLKLWDDIKKRGATVRQARINKKPKELQQDAVTKRTVSLGKRFISELERIAQEDSPGLGLGWLQWTLNVEKNT